MDTKGLNHLLLRAADGELERDEALLLATVTAADSAGLCDAAAARRDRAWGRTLTFSPKVFLPLTNLCRNRCDYCSFRRSPGDEGEWTMRPDEVLKTLEAGATAGCTEALFCLGDTPETAFSAYRRTLTSLGVRSTVEYLEECGERALELGVFPHTNAGILSADDMQRLRRVNVSLGLMLENVSPRLCERGMPHFRAPDKRPEVRLRMTREAGELRIPFTSGLLIGIGETLEERVDTLLAIRDLHREYGHIQEVIVQNFRARPDIVMADSPEPGEAEMVHTIALARVLLEDEISVQAPPNLNPNSFASLVHAGLNDWGGISPVTPDFISPGYPWPHLDGLKRSCESAGFGLTPRLPIYERYVEEPGWLDERLVAPTRRALQKLTTANQISESRL